MIPAALAETFKRMVMSPDRPREAIAAARHAVQFQADAARQRRVEVDRAVRRAAELWSLDPADPHDMDHFLRMVLLVGHAPVVIREAWREQHQ